MKVIQNGKVKFIAVPVPGDAKDFDIEGWYLCYKIESSILERCIKLPIYEYSILGKLSELTEEQCSEFVEQDTSSVLSNIVEHKIFRSYCGSIPFFKTATDSFKSLLQSNGLNLKSWVKKPYYGNYILEKKHLIQMNEYRQKLSEAAEDYLIILIP